MHSLVLVIIYFVIHSVQGSAQWGSWSRYTQCSVTCGVGSMRRSRQCIIKEASTSPSNETCPGAQEMVGPCSLLNCPSERKCNCGCKLTDRQGHIDSSMPYNNNVFCTWTVITKPGSRIELIIQDLYLKRGTLFVSGPHKTYEKINRIRGHEGTIPVTIKSTTNQLNVTLYSHGVKQTDDNIKFQATYTTLESETESVKNNGTTKMKEGESQLNTPAIIGITACGVIILLASLIIGYRKLLPKNQDKNEASTEEMEDNCSSASSSNRSTRIKNVSPRKRRTPGQQVLSSQQQHDTLQTKELCEDGDQQRLLASQFNPNQRGYPDGHEMILPSHPTILMTGLPGYITQPYANWAPRPGYSQVDYRQPPQLPHPGMDYMIKQAQFGYAPQMVYERQPQTYVYPVSGGEG